MNKYALKPAHEAEEMTFDWGRLYWYASGPMGNSEHQTLGLCVLKPGCENPKHYHPNCEEVLHVLAGTIEHFVDGEGWLPMQPGDTITIQTGVWHHARNVGGEEARLLIAFSSEDRQTVGED